MLRVMLIRLLVSVFWISLICIFLFFSFIFVFYKWHERKRHTVHYSGRTAKQFDPVLKVFRDNLRKGWERDGAAFTVFYKGELVVDIWGGYADRECARLWKENTMNVAFSSSKAVGAICVAMLVDRGLIAYSDLVTKFWPKFGKNGKEEITVQMIMSHTAGLAIIDTEITLEDALDHTRMATLFEDQVPNWRPGSRVGYHALTYGWLVDQIIRRVDPKQRSIGTFFKEEIADVHGIDFHLGLPLEESYRVSRLSRPTLLDRFSEFITDPENVDYPHVIKDFLIGGPLMKVGSNPSWLQAIFKMPLNNPEFYPLEQCAVLGICTARAMARLFQLVLEGKIVSQKTLDFISVPVVTEDERDIVTAAKVARGHGLTHLNITKNGRTFTLLGHAGFGGQNVRIDRENDIAFAYLSNGLKGGLGDRARTYTRLLDALYKCIPEVAAAS